MRDQFHDDRLSDTCGPRVLSSLLVVFSLVTASRTDGASWWPLLTVAFQLVPPIRSSGAGASRIIGFCILPLLCVWFPDTLGGLTGGRLTKTSPRSFVWFVGWFVLLLPLVVATILLLEGVRRSPFTE